MRSVQCGNFGGFMAHPPKRSPQVEDEVCRRLSDGETLRSICRDDRMPSWRSIYDWIAQDADFASRIARARELGADAIAEQILDIADTPVVGEEIEESESGMKVRRADMLGHRKLQVETRLKLLAKWFPKKYGDRSAMEVTGADGGPVQISDTQRAAKISAILAAAQARKNADKDSGED